MWWHDKFARGRLVRLAGVGALAVLVAGCFQPLRDLLAARRGQLLQLALQPAIRVQREGRGRLVTLLARRPIAQFLGEVAHHIESSNPSSTTNLAPPPSRSSTQAVPS